MKNVQIKTTGYEMTPEVSSYLDEKLATLDKLITVRDDEVVRCSVEIEHVRDQHADAWRAELNISIGGELIRTEARGENAQVAIDKVKDEMQTRLRKQKRRRFDLVKRGGARLKRMLKFGRQ